MTDETIGRPLYEDCAMLIREYGPQDHEIYFKDAENTILIPRGILRELAEDTPKEKLVGKVNNFNPQLWRDCSWGGIGRDHLMSALTTAYEEGERRQG